MKSSFMIFSLFFLTMITIAIAAPAVTMSWESDFFVPGVDGSGGNPGTNQLRIKLTDIPLNSAKFTPALTTTEVESGIDLTLYQLSLTSYLYRMLHQNSDFKCVDATTYQAVAALDYSGGLFSFITTTEFTLRYPEWSYTVELLCPMSISNVEVPKSTNINFSWIDSDENSQTIPVTLTFPSRGFIKPIIDFKSLKFGNGKAQKAAFSSSQVDIEFTTDTPGVYEVVSVNNFPLSAQLNWSSKQSHDNFFCSAGKEEKFAVVTNNYIFITNPTTEIIKCHFYTQESFFASEQFVSSNRVSVVIQLVDSGFSVARSTDLDHTPGHFLSIYALSEDSTHAAMQIIFQTVMTSTPINTNSTIEFKFSDSFNVETLDVFSDSPNNSDNQDYRGYECDGFDSTISVDKGSNTITLSHISQSSSALEMCFFFFHGSDILDFSQHTRQASISMKIDGKSLTAFNAPEKTQQPIYFHSIVDIKQLSDQVTEVGNEITIVNSFTITDTYSQTFTTFVRPVALFALHGDESFSEDQRESQLKCTSTSPTSTYPKDLVLTFDPDFGIWKAELNDIKEIETFSIKVVCTRTVTKMIKFGRDITPIPSLVINVMDLIDDNRYNFFERTTFNPPDITPMTEQTQEYPEKTILYAALTADMSIPQNGLTQQLPKSTLDAFKSIITDKITTTNALTTYTLATTSTDYVEPRPVYYSLSVQSEFYDYWTTILNSTVDVGSLFPGFGNVLSIYPEDRYPFVNTDIAQLEGQQSVTITQMYQTTITTAAELAESDFNSVNFTKDIYSTTEEEKKRLSEIILLPNQSFKPSYYIYSPIGQCGYESGSYVTSSAIGTSYKPESTSTADVNAAWAAFQDVEIYHYRCPLGESCSINADCVSGNCTGGVCVVQRRFSLPYVHWLDVFSLASKDYYNSSSIITTIGAILITFVVIIF